MSEASCECSAELVSHYQPAPGSYDEWRDENGRPRPHWQALTTYLDQLGRRELRRRQEAARRTILENGVTYNVHGDQVGEGDHPWQLDVLPWVLLENGVTYNVHGDQVGEGDHPWQLDVLPWVLSASAPAC
jgi:uncharacterized circularly permuted ATP-grasp superfamily protein